MIERIVIALIVVLFSLGAYTVGTRWQISRVGRLAHSAKLPKLKPDIPAVIYFWSEVCMPCKIVQTPALNQLQAELGQNGIQVIAINALHQSEHADAWGVLSVPTTFILDRAGQTRRVNHGVTRVEQLREQIKELS